MGKFKLFGIGSKKKPVYAFKNRLKSKKIILEISKKKPIILHRKMYKRSRQKKNTSINLADNQKKDSQYSKALKNSLQTTFVYTEASMYRCFKYEVVEESE